MKFVCVVVSFVSLLYWYFGLAFVAVVVCAIMLKVGSSALVAWVCLPHCFNLSNT